MSSATGSDRGGRSARAAAAPAGGARRRHRPEPSPQGGEQPRSNSGEDHRQHADQRKLHAHGAEAGGRKETAARRRGFPSSPGGDSALDDLDQRLYDLDVDLAVDRDLGVDPDDFTGEGGLETNSAGRPVIRDNRKVDPVSGRPRTGAKAGPAPSPAASGGGQTASGKGTDPPADASPGRPKPGLGEETPDTAEAAARALEDEVVAAAELISTREELAIRTEDLQRLSAEYANYRKRVDRDRSVAGDQARAEVLTALIPVLDDIDAARTAGELEGPFKAVAEKLEAALAKFGLERYGAEGDIFDPTIHEALLHQTDPAVKVPTISLVLQPGYRMGERVLRAARVAVVDSEG
ncbi:MAG: nucleotide exchange factor GrpE [Bifidobacteriaceae bacterium]|jgi:molecular chaperone GrpE|nr:nucleotide exchange factor GrpE [Bifidobacteriaceae bacterium]